MTGRGPRGQMAASRPPLRLVTNLAAASCRLGQEMARRTRRDGKVSFRAFRRYAGDLQSPTDGRGRGGDRRRANHRVSDTLCTYEG